MMASYSDGDIAAMLDNVCPDCRKWSLVKEGAHQVVCEGDCGFFTNRDRYKEVTGQDFAPLTWPPSKG